MKKLLIFALLTGIAVAQIPEAQRTEGNLNGRFWSGLSPSSRLYFVIGFDEAIQLASPETQDRYALRSATFGETVKGLDLFYEDPANASIPIFAALAVFRDKVHGIPPEDLAAYTARLRRLFNEEGKP